jgi:hypothetical protein
MTRLSFFRPAFFRFPDDVALVPVFLTSSANLATDAAVTVG